MNFLVNLWRRMRLAFMMRGMSPEERKKIINQVELEVRLEQYSQSLRRLR